LVKSPASGFTTQRSSTNLGKWKGILNNEMMKESWKIVVPKSAEEGRDAAFSEQRDNISQVQK
jgi:hypothetical protein